MKGAPLTSPAEFARAIREALDCFEAADTPDARSLFASEALSWASELLEAVNAEITPEEPEASQGPKQRPA